MDPLIPRQYYEQRMLALTAEKEQLNQQKNRLAILRFISVIAAFACAWLLRNYGFAPAFSGFMLFTALFIYFLIRDINTTAALENNDRLITINQQELLALRHQYLQFPEGSEFGTPSHPYAADLDIVGRASVYQYINRTSSQQGNALFAAWLTQSDGFLPPLQKQEAVKELAAKAEWRQQLQAFGAANPVSLDTEKKINSWLAAPDAFSQKMIWKITRILMPLISFGLLGLYLTGIIPASTFLPSITLMMILAFSISKLVIPIHSQLSRIAPQTATLSNSIGWIEQLHCISGWLLNIKKIVENSSYKTSGQIRTLGKILERFDLRLNFIVFIPLNTLLFWDLQQVFALEKWKKKNRQYIAGWFRCLAEMEAISSLGNCCFNHPDWCFPVFSEQDAVFSSEALGHPLLPAEKRVTNSFATAGKGQLNLVTGSNMAGKSTFLRSIGVNIVLAMTGGPVCARYLQLSPMKVMSSMRISDNLEESTSTFYAELKKLKEIIETVNRKEKVFLLLDEILRGTNSADRHAGSRALIKQLIQHQAAGLLATHDLELAKLAGEFPSQIQNYHFDVQVADEELYFDYKLKDGICQSMNASILMKKIGIEL